METEVIPQSFRDEVEAWLKPHGYGIHSHNSNGTWFNLICYDHLDENYPAIECYLTESGEKKCKLSDNMHYKLALYMTTGEMSFGHSKIERYINMMKYWADLAQAHAPW